MDSQQLPRNFQPSLNAPLTSIPPQPTASPLPTSSAISQHASDGHSHSPSPSAVSKKRRTPATISTRGVANLTPEQLAKKRANDREAQRAIRERTKTQIERLEKKIEELSKQQPHQELQTVLEQKQRVENENVQIKKKLGAALSLLQPLLQAGPADNSPLSMPDASSAVTPYTLTSVPHSHPAPGAVSQLSDAADFRSRTSASPTSAAPSPLQPNLSPVLRMPIYPSQSPIYSPDPTALEQQRNNLTHGLNMNSSGERLNLGFLLDGRSASHRGGSPHGTARVPHQPRISTNIHANLAGVQTPKPHESFEPPRVAHNVPIRNIPPTCPLDGILLDFLAERRARAAEGASPTNLVGPPYPSVSSLLNSERSMFAHPLSKVFTDILSKFPDLCELPEQVAVLYVMFLIMRWQISPTAENYERLPDWVTPRASQLFTPHPAWVDHLPWPRMRDRMVHLYPDISLDNFFVPYTTTLSLNWRYEPSDTLLSMPGGDEFAINPVFERHLRDLSNWTLGPAFEKAFPQLGDTCKIKKEERGRQGAFLNASPVEVLWPSLLSYDRRRTGIVSTIEE
ncbi:MAG: hypothetical protein Q9173_007023 [Seirophora scorigena]